MSISWQSPILFLCGGAACLCTYVKPEAGLGQQLLIIQLISNGLFGKEREGLLSNP